MEILRLIDGLRPKAAAMGLFMSFRNKLEPVIEIQYFEPRSFVPGADDRAVTDKLDVADMAERFTGQAIVAVEESRTLCVAGPFRRLRRGGWFGLSPREGGTDELSGVLGGSPNVASSSATRAVSSSIRANASFWRVHSAMISASFSACESRLRSGSGGS